MLERNRTTQLTDRIQTVIDSYFYDMNITNLAHESDLYIDLMDRTRDIARKIVSSCELDESIEFSEIEKALTCSNCQQGKDCTMVTCDGYQLCRLLYQYKFKKGD